MDLSDLPKRARNLIAAEAKAISTPDVDDRVDQVESAARQRHRAANNLFDLTAKPYWILLKPDLEAFKGRLKEIADWVGRTLNVESRIVVERKRIWLMAAYGEIRDSGRTPVLELDLVRSECSGKSPQMQRVGVESTQGIKKGAMGKRKTPPLGYSEYVSSEPDNSIQTWNVRSELIEATRGVYPEFLEKLAGEVFPVYRELADAQPELDETILELNPYERLTNAPKLKEALRRWAVGYHAEVGWMLDEALRTLRGWHAFPERYAAREWNRSGRVFSGLDTVGPPFEFQCEGWDVELFDWPRYRNSVDVRFEQALREYEEQTSHLAESRGLDLARRKYSPDNLEWYALHRFAGMSSTKIADRFAAQGTAMDESTILKGIKAAADLLDWPIEHPRQRPRKIR